MDDEKFKLAQEFNTALRWLLAFYKQSSKGTKNAVKVEETCRMAALAMSGDEFAAIIHITPMLIEHGDAINADNWDALLNNDFKAERKEALAKVGAAAGSDLEKLGSETLILVKSMYSASSAPNQEKIRDRVRTMLQSGATYLLDEQGDDPDDPDHMD